MSFIFYLVLSGLFFYVAYPLAIELICNNFCFVGLAMVVMMLWLAEFMIWDSTNMICVRLRLPLLHCLIWDDQYLVFVRIDCRLSLTY